MRNAIQRLFDWLTGAPTHRARHDGTQDRVGPGYDPRPWLNTMKIVRDPGMPPGTALIMPADSPILRGLTGKEALESAQLFTGYGHRPDTSKPNPFLAGWFDADTVTIPKVTD